MKLVKRIIIFFIIIGAIIAFLPKNVYALQDGRVTIEDLWDKSASELSSYVGKNIYEAYWSQIDPAKPKNGNNSEVVYDDCTQHYSDGRYGGRITAIYRTYFDITTNEWKMESVSGKGSKIASGDEAYRAAASMSVANNVSGVRAEITNAIRSKNAVADSVATGNTGVHRPNQNWASSGSNKKTLNDVKNYQQLELVSEGSARDQTRGGNEYVMYGPVRIKYGTAKISVSSSPSGLVTVSTNQSGTGSDLTPNNVKSDKHLYFWVDKDKVPDGVKSVKVTIKQEDIELMESVAICCTTGRYSGQNNIRYTYHKKKIPGGTVSFTIPVENKKGSIGIVKRDKDEKNKSVDMSFIVKVSSKGYISGKKNGKWTYSKNANSAHPFNTSGGNASIGNLPAGAQVSIYETNILTPGYNFKKQDNKITLNGIECVYIGSGTVGGTITGYNKSDKTKISVTVNKVWSGTPKSGNTKIIARLRRNGHVIRTRAIFGNGSYTWEGLATTDENGKEYEYTVDEKLADDQSDVSGSVSGPSKNENNLSFTITNTVTPKEDQPGGEVVINKTGGDMNFIIKAEEIYPVYETYTYEKETPYATKVRDTRLYQYRRMNKTVGEPGKDANYNYVNYPETWVEKRYEDDGYYSSWSSWSDTYTSTTYLYSTDETEYECKAVYKLDKNGKPTNVIDHYDCRYRTRYWISDYNWHDYYDIGYIHKWNDIKGGEVVDDGNVSYDTAARASDGKLEYESHSGWYNDGRNTTSSKDSASQYRTTKGSYTTTLPAGRYSVYEVKSDPYYDLELQEGYDQANEYRPIYPLLDIPQNSNGGQTYILSDATNSDTHAEASARNEKTRGDLTVSKAGEGGDVLEDMDFAVFCVSTKYGETRDSSAKYSGWLTGNTDYTSVVWKSIASIFGGSEDSYYHTTGGSFTITGLPLGEYEIYEFHSREEYYDTELQDGYSGGKVLLGTVTVSEGGVSYEATNKKTRGTLSINKAGEAGEPLDIDVAILGEHGYLSGGYDYVSLVYPDYVSSMSGEPVLYNIDGQLEIKGLTIGTYTIYEYKNNEDYYDIEGQNGYNGEFVELGTFEVVATADNSAMTVTYNNRATRGNLEFRKLLPSGQGASDVEFEIHVTDDITGDSYWLGPAGDSGVYAYNGIDYNSIPKDGGTFVTDASGSMKLECTPIGTYEIYETKTHSIEYALEGQGSYSDGRTLIATINVNSATDNTTWTQESKIQVKRPTGSLEIYKTGHYANDGVEVYEPLPNVSFTISCDGIDIGGWKTPGQQWVYTRINESGDEIIDFTDNEAEATIFVTGADGKITINGLYADEIGPSNINTYTLHEIANDNSYYNDIIVVNGSLENNRIYGGQKTQANIINERSSGDLKITKVDSVYSGDDISRDTLYLEGAKFKVKIIEGQYVDIPSTGLWLRENDVGFVSPTGIDLGTYYTQTGSNYNYDNWQHDVYLTDSSENAATFVTDSNGEFSISRIVNGKYEIWEVETPNGYPLQKQEGYDPSVGMAKVATIDIRTMNNNTVQRKITDQKTVVEINGNVWEDIPLSKQNDYNEIKDESEGLLDGITVELFDKQKQKVIARTVTQDGGKYGFTVKNVEGYEPENPSNIYNSPETDPRINYWELANCYIRFIYDNIGTHDENGYIANEEYGYVTVDAFKDGDSAITVNSKAQEYDMPKDKLQEMNLTGVTGNNPGIAITKPGPDNTDSYVHFANYSEVLSYESKPVQDKLLSGYYNNSTYKIDDIHLGLKGKSQPDFSITEEVAYMKVQFGQYVYKYKYMDENEQISKTVPTVNQQNSRRTFTGQIYPSDIAYNIDSNTDELKVYMVYRIAIRNNTTTNIHNSYMEEKMYVSSLINNYDANRYVLSTDTNDAIDIDEVKRDCGLWSYDGAGTVRYNVNDPSNPYYTGISSLETKTSYLQYRLTEESVRKILTKTLAPEDIVEAPSVTVAKTYHDFWRQDALWNQKIGDDKRYQDYTVNKQIIGYDRTDYLHKSWEQTRTTSELYMRFDLPEKERVVTGTVFEDMSIENETKLGNGIKDSSENTVSEVTVELVDRKNSTTPVKLYQYAYGNTNNYKTDIAYQKVPVGGNFSFTGIIPGYYFLRFTYGDGTVTYTDLDGNNISEDIATEINNTDIKVKTNDYKSTIISANISNSISDAMSRDDSTSDEEDDREKGQWYKDFDANYSTAMDDITERERISGTNVTYTLDDNINPGLIHAFTPRTYITIEDDEDEDKTSTQVENLDVSNADGTLGYTEHYEDFKEFNFGIIMTPETRVKIEKKIVNAEFTTVQGSQLVSDNPKNSNSIYLTDLDRITAGGSKYAKIELDPKLIDNSRVQLTYEITVQNNSDKSWTTDDYLRFGTDRTDPETVTVVVRDYLDEKFEYDKVEKVSDIVEKTSNTIEGNVTIAKATDTVVNPDGSSSTVNFENMSGWTALETGEKETIQYRAYDTLQTAIEDLAFNNDSVIHTMQLGRLNTLDVNTYRVSISPWDRSLVEEKTTFVITPSTGIDRSNTNYIIITIALIVLASGIIIIRKKILK